MGLVQVGYSILERRIRILRYKVSSIPFVFPGRLTNPLPEIHQRTLLHFLIRTTPFSRRTHRICKSSGRTRSPPPGLSPHIAHSTIIQQINTTRTGSRNMLSIRVPLRQSRGIPIVPTAVSIRRSIRRTRTVPRGFKEQTHSRAIPSQGRSPFRLGLLGIRYCLGR
jgi:hypothetical protein